MLDVGQKKKQESIGYYYSFPFKKYQEILMSGLAHFKYREVRNPKFELLPLRELLKKRPCCVADGCTVDLSLSLPLAAAVPLSPKSILRL